MFQAAHNEEDRRVLCTIGHSNHAIEDFLDLLRDKNIDFLIDVRSHPYSRYAPHFNCRDLKAALNAASINYAFFGEELGGRPDGEAFYDEAGYVLYSERARSPQFLEGLARLEKGMARHQIAIMCSEENPSVCHRRLLVARVLHERGVAVAHIRGDGRLQTEAGLREEEAAGPAEQPALFEMEVEEKEWKSLQSVLPGKARRSSLDD